MKEPKLRQVTITDLRYHFLKVERLLRRGEILQVTRRNKVFARLIPASLMSEEEKKQAINAERI